MVESRGDSWNLKAILTVFAVLTLFPILIILCTAPVSSLLGNKISTIYATLHGLVSFIFIIVGTIALYIAWLLVNNRWKSIADLQLISFVMATSSFLTIVLGNLIYIFYRAPTPESPRSWLMLNAPEVHEIFFEFKEFVSIFTFPFSVAAVYILFTFSNRVIENKWLRVVVSGLFSLTYLYLLIAFGLGAAVTKIRPI